MFNIDIFALNFVLENDNNIIAQKTVLKLNDIANELKEKTKISVYLIVKENIVEKNLFEYIKKNHKKNFSTPYVVYALSKQRKLIDIFTSSSILEKSFDKDDVIYTKTLKIIETPGSKAPESALYSAGLLNGFSELCEDIAGYNDVKLVNAIGNESSNIVNIIRFIFYTVMLVFLYIFLRKKFVKLG